jgi:uncharacterized NAD(P)/FAD-binding protein YdhS
MSNEFKLGILGAGFSGKMLAAQLLRNKSFADKCKIYLIDPLFSNGIAYGTPDEAHLLNVRASNMFALANEPNHLVEYLTSTLGEGDWKNTFVSRVTYSKYLDSIFSNSIQHSEQSLVKIVGAVSSVRKNDSGLEVQVGKQTLQLDHLVLAYGNIHTELVPTKNGPVIGKAAWPLDKEVLSKNRILLVGTSLTMIDLALSAARLNPNCQIVAVSRNGLLPTLHTSLDQDRLLKVRKLLEEEFKSNNSLLGVLSTLRRYSKVYPWREVVDGIRPFTVSLWKGFSERERKLFQIRLSTFWSIHRHRVSPDVNDQLLKLISENRLRIIPGKIKSISKSESVSEVLIETKEKESLLLEMDEVINCTGPASLNQISEKPLFASLLREKLISQDKLGLGVSMENSKDDQVLYTELISCMGPPLRGELLECTAVPELRIQVERLAELLNRHARD